MKIKGTNANLTLTRDLDSTVSHFLFRVGEGLFLWVNEKGKKIEVKKEKKIEVEVIGQRKPNFS